MNLDILKEKLKELLNQAEVLKTYYARLTERERYIVLGSVAAGIVFLMVLFYFLLMGINSSFETRLEKNRQALKQLYELKSDFNRVETTVNDMEQMIRRTPPNFQLASRLEEIAQKYGISIGALKDRSGQPNELYSEKQSTVTIDSTDLKTLIHFLHEVENSGLLMRITSLQIKPNFKDASLLNVNFVVSTFQMKEPS